MRGNPAMKAKRVHGPSAQRIMLTYIACERCEHPGCKKPVAVTRNPDGLTRIRTCIDHVAKKRGKNVPRTRAW